MLVQFGHNRTLIDTHDQREQVRVRAQLWLKWTSTSNWFVSTTTIFESNYSLIRFDFDLWFKIWTLFHAFKLGALFYDFFFVKILTLIYALFFIVCLAGLFSLYILLWNYTVLLWNIVLPHVWYNIRNNVSYYSDKLLETTHKRTEFLFYQRQH